MGSLPSTTPARFTPATQSEQKQLNFYHNRLEDDPARGPTAKSFAYGKGPPDFARKEMQARLTEIQVANVPTPDANVDAIIVLLTGWNQYGASAGQIETDAQGWRLSVMEAPAWAVMRAVTRYHRDEVPGADKLRPPSKPQFMAVVRDVMTECTRETRQLYAVLNARVETEVPRSAADKAAVLAALEEAFPSVARAFRVTEDHTPIREDVTYSGGQLTTTED